MAGMWPDGPAAPYGEATFGGPHAFAGIRLAPRLHLPERLTWMARLGREPTPWDVDTTTTIGGFHAAFPFVVPAMGSTPIAHRHGIPLARAAARAGVPLVMGENTATVHGYDEPRGDLPTFKQRALAYLEAGGSGLVFQQSVEDAMEELWWRIYTDPDFLPFLEDGRIGFEIKLGQGAKPGLGGVTLTDEEAPQHVAAEYHLGPARPDGKRERFSAPGTFTTDILEAQVRHLRNDFPKARHWVKIPGVRDAVPLAQAAARGGADLITFDGAEAGTALAPTVFLARVGVPLLDLLADVRAHTIGAPWIASGGLQDGADVVIATALGSVGAAMGRGPLQAAIEAGEEGAAAWFDARHQEVQHIVYALGHEHIAAVTGDDLLGVPAPLHVAPQAS